MRKEESNDRRYLLDTKSPVFYAKQAELWRCAPLANWVWEDIWAYIFVNNIPYSGIYDNTMLCDPRQIRNTSYITTDGAAQGRVAWLKYYYPAEFNRLAARFPEIRRYT